MTLYETLCKLNPNGKLYIWKIEFIDNHIMKVSHGQYGGKMVSHEKEIVPKAKRNHVEQFQLLASRKWEDKVHKEGYVSLVDFKTNLKYGNKNNTNETHNTTNDALIRPMLAQTFDKNKYIGNKKCKKIKFPCWGQPKYDGIRCLMYIKNGEIVMESRKGTSIYHFDKLRHQFSQNLAKEEHIVFDGELYVDTLPFEKINGLVRLKKANEEQFNEINKIQYHIYDIIDKSDLSCDYDMRRQKMEYIEKKYNLNEDESLIKVSSNTIINTLDDVDTCHAKFVSQGYEGLILRNMDGKYEINKRSYDLQKYKHFMDEEFEIIDYGQGSGDEKGLIIFKCKTKDDKEFSVRPRGTRETRRAMFKEGDTYIGKQLTVIFQEYSVEGIPRFPVGKSIRYAY